MAANASSLCGAYSSSIIEAVTTAYVQVPTTQPEYKFRLATAEALGRQAERGSWGPGILEEIGSIAERATRVYGREVTRDQVMIACNTMLKRSDK